MEGVIQQKVLEVAKQVESQLDAEIEALENLDIDDIEKLREKRLQEMKKVHQQKQAWLAAGHGEYTEIPDEKGFFDVSKKSKNIVCLFYKDGSPRCKIADKHLQILAKKHVEARFCKLNVERCPFLTERLRIKVIPTIALISDSKTKDYIVGFTDLGNCDDFSTEMMEWRIAQSGAISYTGDLLNPPEKGKKSSNLLVGNKKSKTIRGRTNSDDSGSDDE
ncbi:thioredoxin domain-containing protein 9 isoform X1 [Diachasma alloeum]|uniref:thioredoxin domain-containing protein 9 isoform X1 n=1 Tax=Diachasma alloeum TaxID=454923 RepID=UPI0007383B02|nr:thioredoxin domain-containing protein 9 isoform X1 [Diachasma alloeum]XP_015111154.1 thioredoxin domain-containing protein 9 isoform X1 [Diachasma alloeum]